MSSLPLNVSNLSDIQDGLLCFLAESIFLCVLVASKQEIPTEIKKISPKVGLLSLFLYINL